MPKSSSSEQPLRPPVIGARWFPGGQFIDGVNRAPGGGPWVLDGQCIDSRGRPIPVKQTSILVPKEEPVLAASTQPQPSTATAQERQPPNAEAPEHRSLTVVAPTQQPLVIAAPVPQPTNLQTAFIGVVIFPEPTAPEWTPSASDRWKSVAIQLLFWSKKRDIACAILDRTGGLNWPSTNATTEEPRFASRIWESCRRRAPSKWQVASFLWRATLRVLQEVRRSSAVRRTLTASTVAEVARRYYLQ